MCTPKTVLRGSAVAATAVAALVGLGAGPANAAGRPPLQPGAHLYTGTDGSGTATTVDLADLGTCHTLATPARSVQVANGSASVVLYPGAGCAGAVPWATGSLAQSDTPWAMRSYRVIPA
ncbi:hypothetical protein [Streptomyces sp. CBMA123]|uniref:hypothetical protein n=1 Tax=Streptomyces sp. CBMA123 TaxID=1896313 RepID=UPI001661F307|nr:hypothetical protein [Streptomyces sp. CBMA123]MBD0694618.1 hypothetical protein [Streptomyces sp. CBMA123]